MFSEHNSKRLRETPPPKPGDARSRYLDTVPDDSLRIVLRYLSNRPQHRNWHTSISPSSVKTVFDVGGALARAASSEFHSIGGEDGILLVTTLDASMLCPIAHRLPLRRLVFDVGGGEVLCNFLRGCGAELKELVVDTEWSAITETDILAISTHCKKLSSLAISGHLVKSPLTPIWRSLGSTLTRIYIGCYSQYSTAGYGFLGIMGAPDLVKLCVNLRRVDLKKLHNAAADVLVALGTRIRVLSIEHELDLHTASCREVFRACTNLEAVYLKLPRYNSEEAVNVLSSMRTKLVSLTLDNPMPREGQFFSVLSACSALKQVQLDVSRLPLEILRKLLESLKSVTTMTCDMSFFHVNPCKDVIDVIGSNLTNLETFTTSTREPLKGEDVNALVGLPRLKYVTLRHLFSEECDSQPLERCAVDVVNKFKDCAHLVQLEIIDFSILSPYRRGHRSQRIAEAAVMYDRKDFDMFIDGVQYRTW